MMTNTMTAAPTESIYTLVGRIGSRHINLSAQYGCRAYMTVATFLFAGIMHRARLLFRADMAEETGKIELYTIAPFPGDHATTCTPEGWYASTASEDFLGYVADEPTSRRDRLACHLVSCAVTGDAMGLEFAERVAQLEMV